ncbi:hypothetical protein V8G54_030723 [Vigna mungo]|uniref:Uncharacterized protein n=1 Tax=Vigna mungo TaxID=3915 RepID=A0AAQ3MX08_VIGMU
MHSKVFTSSSLSKKTSTPSPYKRTRTFLTSPPFLEGHFTWKTSLVIAPFNGITCKVLTSSIASPISDATAASTSIISSCDPHPFNSSIVLMAILENRTTLFVPKSRGSRNRFWLRVFLHAQTHEERCRF